MFFVDKNNLYLHDGQTPKPIGGPILRAGQSLTGTYAWTNSNVTKDNTKVWFDSLRKSYIAKFRS